MKETPEQKYQKIRIKGLQILKEEQQLKEIKEQFQTLKGQLLSKARTITNLEKELMEYITK